MFGDDMRRLRSNSFTSRVFARVSCGFAADSHICPLPVPGKNMNQDTMEAVKKLTRSVDFYGSLEFCVFFW